MKQIMLIFLFLLPLAMLIYFIATYKRRGWENILYIIILIGLTYEGLRGIAILIMRAFR